MPLHPIAAATQIRSRGLVRCRGCGLPEETLCLCGDVTPIETRTRVVVVAHHVEIKKSTNTGRLLALVAGADLRVRGEPGREERAPLPQGRRLALYPSEGARELGPADATGEPVVLLVPDGNWNQARRIVKRDPDFAGAEVVRLPPGPSTRYALRRHPRPDGLATLEAVARALGILEGPRVEEALVSAFESFVTRASLVRASGKGGHAIREVSP